MPIGRPTLHYGFKREPGYFCARVVEVVGIERLRIGQGQVIVRGAAGGQRGEEGQAGEDGDCTELP